jgi:hypothetical protein
MSFAAEMRDFIAGWTAVNEMGNKKRQLDLQKQEIENLKAYRDATLEMDQEKLELSRANAARSAGIAAERLALAREKAEAEKYGAVLEGLETAQEPEYDWSEAGGTGGDGGTGEAIPLYTGEFPDETTPRGEYSRGGLVALAADGGMIYDELGNATGMTSDGPAVEEAIPVAPRPAAQEAPRPARAAGLATPPAEPADAPEPDPAAVATVAEGAKAAVAAAAPELVADTKKPDAAIGPEAETEKMDIVNNRGGLSVDEYKELVATIDPNGSIPAYMESAAVLSSTYKYFMEQGEPQKAAKVAKGILILNKQMTQTLGALAVNALEEGNTDIATRLLSDAANKFPTGQKFQVVPTENGVAFQIMENGEVAQQGELNTDQLWAMAAKVKDGSLYIEEMGRLATANQGPKRVGPTEALDLTANAYVRAMQAVEALDAAEQEGASEEELKALRGEARNAKATYDKFFNNATSMGIKRTDIMARGEQMLEMAIPEEPQAVEGEPASGEQGWFSWMLNRANPVSALRDDVQMLTGDEAGATSEGNPVQFDELPTPRTREERDALPPGTQYVAPDGSIRTR